MRNAMINLNYKNKEGLARIFGKATEVNEYGNVMFYPDNNNPVYRICLRQNDITYIEKSAYGKKSR